MLKTLDTVYIYIVRFNKKEKVNIEVKNKAMYFRRMICPLSSRQVKYLKIVFRNDCIFCSHFYAHHFSLYFLIRLFSGIGYSIGVSKDRASVLTSNGVLQ